MDADTRVFVLSCSVCACGKFSHQPPAGLLHPLSVPGCSWSHIVLDFVTGFPPSQGNTVILSVLWLSVYSPQPLKQLTWQTSFRTGVLSSSRRCEKLSAKPSEPRLASPCVSIPRPTDSQSGPIRIWELHFVELQTGTHRPLVEYAHNSLSSAATGMSLFECSLEAQKDRGPIGSGPSSQLPQDLEEHLVHPAPLC